MRFLGLLTFALSAIAQAAPQTGTLIIDRRDKVGGTTQLYVSTAEFCGAPYTGHGLDVHGEGMQGVESVMALAEGQYLCPNTQYEEQSGIAVVKLGDCQKTSSDQLNSSCTGTNSMPNVAVHVQCDSAQFNYNEVRFRELVNGFWMRRSAVNISAPNAQPYSAVWSEEAGGEPSAGDSVGAPYPGVESNWRLLQDNSTKDVQDVVFRMQLLVYKNPPTKVGEPSSPVKLSDDMVTCEYKCVRAEGGECGFAGLAYPF